MVESGLFRARRKLSEEYEELASGKRCEQIQTAIEGGRLRTVTSLGLRDRRRFARHLSHCQLCRHAALMAGVDEALVRPRSIAAKIAALLPFPVWRLFGRSRGAKAASANGSHHVAGAGSAGLAKSAGSAITLGQAAATVAVVIAGAGGGLAVTGLGSGGHARPPAMHRSAHQAAATSGSSGSATAAGAAAAAAAKRGGTSTTAKTAGFSAPRTATRQRGGARKQRGSTPGAPGSGTSSGGSGSSSSPGSGHGRRLESCQYGDQGGQRRREDRQRCHQDRQWGHQDRQRREQRARQDGERRGRRCGQDGQRRGRRCRQHGQRRGRRCRQDGQWCRRRCRQCGQRRDAGHRRGDEPRGTGRR